MENFSIFSAVLTAVFAYAATATRNGKLDFLGQWGKEVPMDRRPQYCKEMSTALYVIAAIELIDTAIRFAAPSIADKPVVFMVIMAAIVACIIWVFRIQKKYTK